jgi:hypothetical protein
MAGGPDHGAAGEETLAREHGPEDRAAEQHGTDGASRDAKHAVKFCI